MADPVASEPRTEVDDATLARILRCDPVAIRKYVRVGVIKRESNRKFLLFQSIGDVVDYLRGMASRMGTAETMKSSAALKDAQRRLTETKLAKLDGQLISLPECEALWGDLAAAAKWLFLALPVRLSKELKLSAAQEEQAQMLCVTMLRQVALSGAMQLPSAEKSDDALDDDDSDSGESSAAEPEAG